MAVVNLDELTNRAESDAMRSLENPTDVVDTAEPKPADGESPTYGKQLVFLAGPQQSGMKAVQQFFVYHASDYRKVQHAESLSGWYWPMVNPADLPEEYQDVPHHTLFDLFLHGHGNDDVFYILMEAIRTAWHESENGVVLGSELFDRYMTNKQHSMAIMKRIASHLHIEDPQTQVSIVINYDTPRLNHMKRFIEEDAMQASASFFDYKGWLCDESAIDQRYNLFDTALNPLKLAHAARQHEWSVFLMDSEGLRQANQDPAHTIACQVFRNTQCHEGGYLKGLEDKIVDNLPEGQAFYHGQKPQSVEDSMQAFKTLSGLSYGQTTELETMLVERDCSYRAEFMHDDPGVRVLHKSSLWDSCESDDQATARYTHLSNSTTLLFRVQEQKDCAVALYAPVVEADAVSGADEKSMSYVGPAIALAVIVVGLLLCFARAIRRRRRQLESESKTQQLDDAENIQKDLESPSSLSTASSSSSSSPTFGRPSPSKYSLGYRSGNDVNHRKEPNLSPRKDTEMYLEEKRRNSAFQYDYSEKEESLIIEDQLNEIDMALAAMSTKTYSSPKENKRISPRNNLGELS